MPKRKTILLVEDDLILRDLYKERLQKDRFEVWEAKSGEEAMRLLTKKEMNLVLLDLRLPGISGFEVLEKIRKNEELKDLPVAIFSVLGKSEDRARAHRLGANAYLVKAEVMPGEVAERIKKMLS